MKSAHCDPRLDETVESLGNNIRLRKKLSKFLARQKPNLLHQALCPDWVRARSSPSASPASQDGYTHRERKPLPADEVKVRLYREPIIRCLYPKRFSGPLNFRGHSALVLEGEQVLDHRIAKNHIQAVISELSEIPGVTGEWPYVRVALLLGHEIQRENLDVRALVPAPIFPKRVCTAYVEKPQRSRQACSKSLKLPETPRAKLVRKRGRIVAVC